MDLFDSVRDNVRKFFDRNIFDNYFNNRVYNNKGEENVVKVSTDEENVIFLSVKSNGKFNILDTHDDLQHYVSESSNLIVTNVVGNYKIYKEIDGLYFNKFIDDKVAICYPNRANEASVNEIWPVLNKKYCWEVTTYISHRNSEYFKDLLYTNKEIIRVNHWDKIATDIINSVYNIKEKDIKKILDKEKNINQKNSVENLYNDLGINLDNVRYCENIKPLLSKEIIKDFEHDSSFAVESLTKYGEDYLRDNTLDMKKYSNMIFCETIFDSKNLFCDQFHIEDDNVEKSTLKSVVEQNLSDKKFDKFDRSYSNLLASIDKDFVVNKKIEVAIQFEEDSYPDIVDYKNSPAINCFSMKSSIIKDNIKEKINNFLDGINNNDDNKIKKSLEEVALISYISNESCKNWLSNKGIDLLCKQFNENKFNSMLLVEKNIKNDGLSKKAYEETLKDCEKLESINKEINSTFYVGKDLIENNFKKYCDGKNDNFIKNLKLELLEQKKLLSEYNNIVNKINKVYEKYHVDEIKQNEELVEKKDINKQNNYNILRNKYGISKNNNNEQELNR